MKLIEAHASSSTVTRLPASSSTVTPLPPCLSEETQSLMKSVVGPRRVVHHHDHLRDYWTQPHYPGYDPQASLSSQHSVNVEHGRVCGWDGEWA